MTKIAPRRKTAPRTVGEQLLTRLQALPVCAIANADDAEVVTEQVRQINDWIEYALSKFDPICKDTDRAHKTAVRERDSVLKPLTDAKKARSRVLGAWEEERQRLQCEAERQEREGRDQIERQAREAKELELKARAEAQLALAKANGDEAATLGTMLEDVRRAAAEESGFHDPVEAAVVQALLAAPTLTAAPALAKTQGLSGTPVYEVTLDDIGALIEAAAKEPRLHCVLSLNEQAVRALARAVNGDPNIPGVTVVRRLSGRVS